MTQQPGPGPQHDIQQPPPGYAPQPYPQYGPPRRGRLAVVLAVVAALVVGGIALSTVDWFRGESRSATSSYDAARTVELVADGAVTVRAGGDGRVSVERIARGWLRSPDYSARGDSDRLTITHQCGGWNFWPLRCSGSLDVTLPADTDVVVRTSNGTVVASGVAGSVDLRSSNGRVEATGIDGRLQIRTSNGRVTVTDAGDDVEARSSNGTVEVRRVAGSLVADTSNGRITVDTVGGDARATTSNGSVEVRGVGGNVVATTSNGSVTVHGGTEPVALTIETTNGRRTVEGATDPNAERTVEIRSRNGAVSYLGS